MDEEIYTLLLNGMPFKTFLGFFLLGMAGAFMFYLGKLYKKINQPVREEISWRRFIAGAIHLILSVMSLAVCIIYFKEISPFLFNITDSEHQHVVNVNGFSSLMLGMAIDRLWTSLLQASQGGAKLFKKR